MRLLCLLGLLVVAAGGCGESGGGGGGGDGSLEVGADAGWDADDEEPLDPRRDSDGDGLEDRFEEAAGDPTILDPDVADTNGDGIPDGDEDPDRDRLTNLEEQALSRAGAEPVGASLHPLRHDLLVELDAIEGRTLGASVLEAAAEVFAAAAVTTEIGPGGVGLFFFRDEESIPARTFDGSFEGRRAFLASHGPTGAAELPWGRMIHVMSVTERSDNEFRGGDTVAGGDDVAQTGVLIYVDALERLFPDCGVPGDATRPDITVEEALASALVHELGHTVQLGHDTEAGGGINYWNVMSVPETCTDAQRRFHGLGNDDETLGATEREGAPRFSAVAARRMRLRNALSVQTATLADGDDGYEM